VEELAALELVELELPKNPTCLGAQIAKGIAS